MNVVMRGLIRFYNTILLESLMTIKKEKREKGCYAGDYVNP